MSFFTCSALVMSGGQGKCLLVQSFIDIREFTVLLKCQKVSELEQHSLHILDNPDLRGSPERLAPQSLWGTKLKFILMQCCLDGLGKQRSRNAEISRKSSLCHHTFFLWWDARLGGDGCSMTAAVAAAGSHLTWNAPYTWEDSRYNMKTVAIFRFWKVFG